MALQTTLSPVAVLADVPPPKSWLSPPHDVARRWADLVAAFYFHLHTLFLFTYTDYKTIFCPITLFALAAAPVASPAHLLRAMAWVWLHLLQCNVSNQCRSRSEDAINRPWRPLPAGRVSQPVAEHLRWILVVLCLTLSGAAHGRDVLLASALLTFTTIVYDEAGLAGHWVGKNFCNIGGYCSFELGATRIMSANGSLDGIAVRSILLSGAVIFTTIQAQDFADVEGDAALGRLTFPMFCPRLARWATLGAMLGWSAALGAQWGLGPGAQTLFCLLGASVGLRYFAWRDPRSDRRSYLVYNLWLMLAHILPAHARWHLLSF